MTVKSCLKMATITDLGWHNPVYLVGSKHTAGVEIHEDAGEHLTHIDTTTHFITHPQRPIDLNIGDCQTNTRWGRPPVCSL